MKKLIAAISAAVVAIALAPSADAATAPQAGARAIAYQPPPINWGVCTNATLVSRGAQCGFLVVPRDYGHPRGAKLKLAVSRVLHKTPTSQGVMLVNPGGPGGSGLIYSVLQTAIPNGAGLGYDWIGFEPRGVGSSKPAVSCNSTFFHGDRPPYRPTTRKIHRQWVARSKAYARQCSGRALLQHVKTTDSVKDMESLRLPLGPQKINFYGFSYGTYLGQVYATQPPNRVRRFVFD